MLREVFAFCGVDTDAAVTSSIYERYRYGKHGKDEVLSGGLVWSGETVRAGADVGFPEDFIGPARAGVWKEVFGPEDREAFELAAGDLLVDLGYEPDRSWAGTGTRGWTPIPARG
jgi:hypothetical protein